MRMTARIVGVGVLTLVAATAAHAQDGGTTAAPVAHNQVISASPLLMMFKWFNLDYERKISPAVTLGASGSYLPLGDDYDYQRATFHARYYPQGAALTGFYMGAQTGVHRAGSKRDHETLLGAGVDLGYAWLLGPNRNHSVSVGLGMTRMFAGNDLDGSLTLPNLRLLNIGFAF
jgi:hypothetical protein